MKNATSGKILPHCCSITAECIVVEVVALSGFTLHNPNVVQIALLKNLNSIQGLTQRVMKPYMYSGATITYLGLSNNWNELDDEENQVCRTMFNEIITILRAAAMEFNRRVQYPSFIKWICHFSKILLSFLYFKAIFHNTNDF